MSSIQEMDEQEAIKSPSKKKKRKDRLGKSIGRGHKKYKVTF